jgi:thioesterase domain-containing protein
MDELVDRYIQEMRTVQPQGPYLLGGVSFGGMVALAVAQRLQADGQEVALLALLDTPAPNAFSPKPINQRLRGHVNNTLKFGLKYLVKKFGNRWDWIRFLRLRLAGEKTSNVDRYRFVQAAYKQMTINYTPEAYSGRVALFLASDRDALSNSICDPELVTIDANFGWGNLVTGELHIYEVPGDHLGILKEPQVQVLAQKLKACLAESTPSTLISIASALP